MPYIKNMEQEKVLDLAGEVCAQPGQVVSKTLAQNDAVSVTLFAFSKDEEISTHSSKGDAMVLVLEGKGRISREAAMKKVGAVYEEFRKKQDADYISDFDRAIEKYLKGGGST